MLVMPANLTPQYSKAEEVYRQAKTNEEKIAALEEMIRLLPKHKGTDSIYADLKKRLSKLKDSAEQESKNKKKVFDPFRLEKQGAAQVLVLGGPNAGKSALVSKLTSAPTHPTPYPFSTLAPIPGMMRFEDVQIQLVDLPSFPSGDLPAGFLGLAKQADGAVLLADLESPEVLDHVEGLLRLLAEGHVRLVDSAPREESDTLSHDLPTLLLAVKVDVPGARDMLPLVAESLAGRFTPVPVSMETGEGLSDVPRRVFEMLRLIRVYSKKPGKPADYTSPFTLPKGKGGTVVDLAGKIHRDFPENLREARIWGSARFEGQAVPRDFVLSDKDVVELHVDAE